MGGAIAPLPGCFDPETSVFSSLPPSGRSCPLCHSTRTGQKAQTSHVVGQIPQPYLHSRSRQPDATNQKRARSLQVRPKNILNSDADATARAVPLLLPSRQGLLLLPLALKLRTIAQCLSRCWVASEKYAESADTSRLVFSDNISKNTWLSCTLAALTCHLRINLCFTSTATWFL